MVAKARTGIAVRGYKLQVSTKSFVCDADQCAIHQGQEYVRVVRLDNKIEVFAVACFRDEFGIGQDAPLAR